MGSFTQDELSRLAKFAGHKTFVGHGRVAICPPGGPLMSGIHWKPDQDRNQCADIEGQLSRDQEYIYSEAIHLWAEGEYMNGSGKPLAFLRVNCPPEIRCRCLLEILPEGETE